MYVTCMVPVNLSPHQTRKQAWRRGNLQHKMSLGMTVSKHKEQRMRNQRKNQPQALKTAAICNHKQLSTPTPPHPYTVSQSGQAEGASTCNTPGPRKICPFYRKGTCQHGLWQVEDALRSPVKSSYNMAIKRPMDACELWEVSSKDVPQLNYERDLFQ